MANMSYCRFENTYGDLADCVNALDDVQYGEEISRREWNYAKMMYEFCQRYIDTFDELDESNINFED